MDSSDAALASQEAEDDFGENLEACILAIDLKDKRFGSAYYIRDEQCIYMMPETQESPPYDHIAHECFLLEPNLLLATSRSDALLQDEDQSNDAVLLYKTVVRPLSDFSIKTIHARLSALSLEQNDAVEVILGPTLSEREARRRHDAQKMSTRLDFSAKLSLGCVNALFLYLDRRRTHATEDAPLIYDAPVRDVQMAPSSTILTVPKDCMYALQIMEEVDKSSTERNKADPPTSVFRLLNLCKTKGGKSLMRQWFLRPTQDIVVINERHDAIETLTSSENRDVAQYMRSILRKMTNMREALNKLQEGKYGRPQASQWQAISMFCLNMQKLLTSMAELSDMFRLPIIQRLNSAADPICLQETAVLICDVVDFDDCGYEDRIVVKRSVDDDIDEYKEIYDNLEEILTKACKDVVVDLQPAIVSVIRCVYLPQLGFLTTFTPEEHDDEIISLLPQAWEYMFTTQSTMYYKNEKMNELDEYFGDIHSLMVDREIEILYQLQCKVLPHGPMLVACSDAICELDCLLALADAAIRYNYTRPTMTEDIVLDIVKGRHPLRDSGDKAFIANNTQCFGDATMYDPIHPTTILLTGANYSGKSVYLRQAALIVFMAHIGSFVPAESATVGITDRILTRLHTRDSLSDGVSAFMSDLQQISRALSWMTPRSLLIIDEFGQGTDPFEGAGLFAALVNWLTTSGSFRPRSIIATHYHEVLRHGLLNITPALSLKHMRIMLDPKHDDFAKQMTYLYQLADGPSDSSFALNCAAMNGVPKSVIHRAEQLLTAIKNGEDLTDVMRPISAKEREEVRYAERVARRFLKWDYRSETPQSIIPALEKILL